ncbi:MAG: Rieske 2Fe-2S domain-containing protein [Planctomycetes bacterium]|nr:Rieske 2Fe-2S domain-containing protein [Planctomycetota bacterium]
MARVRLCALSQAPAPGKGRHVDVPPGPGVALFSLGNGEFAAIEDNCPHMDAPLHDGICARGVVTCQWHGWQFDLRTGESLMSENIRVKRFPVVIEDGSLWAELP